MIHVIAVITTHPGQRDTVLAAFRKNRPAVLGESGCLEYLPVVDAEGGRGSERHVLECPMGMDDPLG